MVAKSGRKEVSKEFMEDLLNDLSELGIELEPEQLERFQNNLKINKTFASIAKSTSILRNKKGIFIHICILFSLSTKKDSLTCSSLKV